MMWGLFPGCRNRRVWDLEFEVWGFLFESGVSGWELVKGSASKGLRYDEGV